MTATSMPPRLTLSEDESEVLAALKAGSLSAAIFSNSLEDQDVTFHLRDRCRALHSLQRRGLITGFRTVQMASGRELPVLKDVALLKTSEAFV